MRSKTLKIALALGLVVGLAAPVLAQPTNATERQDAAKERHDALLAAREAALGAFRENRTLILDEYHAALNATRASFLENKTAVLGACAAARNATGGNETAKCVQDGLKPLIEKARGEMQAAREHALEQLKAEARKGMSAFAKARAAANERYRGRAGEDAPGA